MYDGIHKNAPVSNDWKSLIKICTQEVWKDRAPRQAEKIILKPFNELKPLVKQAEALFSNPQPCLNSSMDVELLRCSCTTKLQEQLVDSLERHLARHTQQPINQACTSVLQATLDANLRNIDGYLALKRPQDRAEMNDRLRQSMNSIDIERHITDLVAGVKPQLTSLPPLTLDEVIA
ncbi:MAG: hypothetical protein BWK78_09405 [Thiotrichaceae bacterium IS1]|nr:MAG: hypothetical protein BWK78_09405 [Thiotrichaceae bacterium IS1]